MRTVVLVPYRAGGDARRIWTWGVCRPYLLAEGWPIYEGQPSTPIWNRAEACNAAARDAGDWDVAVIADADTIHEPGILAAGVEHATSTGHAVIPWSQRWKLSEHGTGDLARHGIGPDLDVEETNKRWNGPGYPAWKCGSTIIIPRRAWKVVGGFDESFTVWGHEDCAQRMALETLVGLKRLPGTIWHLWHPHDVRSSAANRRRFGAYERAYQKPERMRALVR